MTRIGGAHKAASIMDHYPARKPNRKGKEGLASKEDRKKTAVRRMETLSPPSTSTPMAMRASIHLHSHHVLSAHHYAHACTQLGMCRKECSMPARHRHTEAVARVRVACLSGSFWYTP